MNKNNKELTVRVHVRIDGEYHDWESLTKEQQHIIGVELNNRALRVIGYTPIEK